MFFIHFPGRHILSGFVRRPFIIRQIPKRGNVRRFAPAVHAAGRMPMDPVWLALTLQEIEVADIPLQCRKSGGRHRCKARFFRTGPDCPRRHCGLITIALPCAVPVLRGFCCICVSPSAAAENRDMMKILSKNGFAATAKSCFRGKPVLKYRKSTGSGRTLYGT